MEKKKILVSIVTGKGGAGKSTITQTVAATLNKYYDLDVSIIDVDGQKSIYNLRQKELSTYKEDSSLLKELSELKTRGKKVVDIYKAEPNDLEFIAETSKKYDITFIDMPGSLSVPGVKDLYFFLNYAFVPFYTDRFSFTSDIQTLTMIKKMYDSKKSRLNGYAVFFNKYTSHKNKALFDELENMFKKEELHVLNHIYENVKYQREWMSTIKAVPYSATPKSLHTFIDSMLNYINNN